MIGVRKLARTTARGRDPAAGGLWELAEQAKVSLPETADLDRVAEFALAHGITRVTLVSLLGGSH